VADSSLCGYKITVYDGHCLDNLGDIFRSDEIVELTCKVSSYDKVEEINKSLDCVNKKGF
jgi:hypothetical protein